MQDTLKEEYRYSKWSYKAQKGEIVPQLKKWRWVVAKVFMPISLLTLAIAIMFLRIANFLMADTHHLQLTVNPKINK